MVRPNLSSPHPTAAARPAAAGERGWREVEDADAGVVSGPGGELTPLEREVVEFFVALAQALGFPKSLGEIYGLVYASPKPLAFGDIHERLRMSKGSASQGLRVLASLGALRTVYVPGDRRDHFVPEASLRQLVARLVQDKFGPHLDGGRARLERMEALLGADGAALDPVVVRRVGSLQTWHRKAERLLPYLKRFLG